MDDRGREYGYLSPTSEPQWIHMSSGQNIAGHSVGILCLQDVWYPIIPGNVANASTYDFPVRLKAVSGLGTPALHGGAPELAEGIIRAARELEQEGVRAISAACGFFGHYQSIVADAVDVPVGLSSLVQIPWIRTTIGPNRKIGILTANAVAITEKLLRNCQVVGTDDLVIRDLRHESHFSAIMEDRGGFDNTEVRKEVVQAAVELVESDPVIAAILLECSDLPPYAWEVQRATRLPVHDFTTLIGWLHAATTHRPYHGFI